jgi:hypothetical protein
MNLSVLVRKSHSAKRIEHSAHSQERKRFHGVRNGKRGQIIANLGG